MLWICLRILRRLSLISDWRPPESPLARFHAPRRRRRSHAELRKFAAGRDETRDAPTDVRIIRRTSLALFLGAHDRRKRAAYGASRQRTALHRVVRRGLILSRHSFAASATPRGLVCQIISFAASIITAGNDKRGIAFACRSARHRHTHAAACVHTIALCQAASPVRRHWC